MVGLKQTKVLMHRVITNAQTGMSVDHINGNKLDNRRANLRLCNSSENSRNRSLASINTSGYKGVTWHKQTQKWQAQIEVNGRNIHLGLHQSVILAAIAYNNAALKYFGEFAKLNAIEVLP
jgi:hypothetical protein